MDTCATAVDLTGALPYSASLSTTAAATSTGLPSGNGYGQSFETSVEFPAWFRYTPTANQRIVIDTAGSSYDTYVQAYSGGCAGLTPIDSNDDRAAGTGTATKAYLTLDLTAGTTYFFVVGTFDGVGGTLDISIAATHYPIFRSINPVINAGGPLTVNVPGSPKGPSAGDLVFVLIGHKEASYSTPPAGFTLVDRAISGSTRGELYVKTAGTNEIALGTYSFTLARTGNIAAVGLAFAVADGTLDAHSVRANAAGASGSPSITATNPYNWVLNLAVGGTFTFPSTFSSWATGSPGSLTMLEVEDSGTLNETDVRIGFASAQMTPAGATGESSWAGTSGDTVGFLIVVGAAAPSSRNLLTGQSHTVQGSDNLIVGSGGTVTGDVNALFALCDDSPAPAITGNNTFKVCADTIDLTADSLLFNGVSHAPIQVATVILDDAEIRALPTTPITLVPAAGVGLRVQLIQASLRTDFTAGAYTNIGAIAPYIVLTLGSDEISTYIAKDATATPAQTKLTSFLSAAAKHATLFPWSEAETSSGWGVVTGVDPVDANQPLQIVAVNDAAGDFTGGNPANTLTATVLYLEL